MKAFRTLAVAAVLLTSAPVLAAPSTSSVSFSAGIVYDAKGVPLPITAAADLLDFTANDPTGLATLDGLGPINTFGFLALTGFSLNVPDPNLPVTLSLGIDLTITGSTTAAGINYPVSTHVTSLPSYLDPFARHAA